MKKETLKTIYLITGLAHNFICYLYISLCLICAFLSLFAKNFTMHDEGFIFLIYACWSLIMEKIENKTIIQ